MSSSNQDPKQYLLLSLADAWNASSAKWEELNVQLADDKTVKVCITAWSLIHGFASSTIQDVAAQISSGQHTSLTRSVILYKDREDVGKRQSMNSALMSAFQPYKIAPLLALHASSMIICFFLLLHIVCSQGHMFAILSTNTR